MNLEALARETPIAELPKLAGMLAEAQAIILSRLTAPTVAAVEPDRLLSAEEASRLCGLDVKSLKRRRDLPFRRIVGPRTVRYSLKAIRAWQKRAS